MWPEPGIRSQRRRRTAETPTPDRALSISWVDLHFKVSLMKKNKTCGPKGQMKIRRKRYTRAQRPWPTHGTGHKGLIVTGRGPRMLGRTPVGSSFPLQPSQIVFPMPGDSFNAAF
ncbi:uncharacterized protein LOC144068854 [Stigmatopora argus]